MAPRSILMHACCRAHLRTTAHGAWRVRSVECYGRGKRALAELFAVQEEESSVRRRPLQPYEVTPTSTVPEHIPKPTWYSGRPASSDGPPEVHDTQGIERMRASGRLAAQVLDMAGKMVAPGITTDAIDRAVHDMTVQAGAYPSPLLYGVPPFPKSVCTSVNEVICHGIPDKRPLQEGDIINIDVTVWLDGYHGDTSRMFFVGAPSQEAQELVSATYAALDAGIDACGPGVDFREIGKAVQAYVNRTRFHINRDFIGHGVGKAFHAKPAVLPFRNSSREGTMRVGQTFTIEPILHAGRNVDHKLWKDGWTAVSRNGTLSAQAEHTVLVTNDGVDILTAYDSL